MAKTSAQSAQDAQAISGGQLSSAEEPSDALQTGGGKGRPTPSRKEREAARKRPLVADDRKEARKEARAKMQQTRNRARVGLANGEERYLPARDKGPQRKYIRDHVDARYSVGEFLLPVMVVVLIVTAFPSEIAYFALFGVWTFVALAILDVVLLGFSLKRKLGAKFGEDRVERGYRWYAAMRALQLRPMRLPKPQVKRGAFPS